MLLHQNRNSPMQSGGMACYALGLFVSILLSNLTISAEIATARLIQANPEEIQELTSQVKFFRQAIFLTSVFVLQCLRTLIQSTTYKDMHLQMSLENDLAKGVLSGFALVGAALSLMTEDSLLQHPAILVEALFYALWFVCWICQKRNRKDKDGDEEQEDDDDEEEEVTRYTPLLVTTV